MEHICKELVLRIAENLDERDIVNFSMTNKEFDNILYEKLSEFKVKDRHTKVDFINNHLKSSALVASVKDISIFHECVEYKFLHDVETDLLVCHSPIQSVFNSRTDFKVKHFGPCVTKTGELYTTYYRIDEFIEMLSDIKVRFNLDITLEVYLRSPYCGLQVRWSTFKIVFN